MDELKSVIHDVITEDMEIWRETFEILADKKLMKEIRKARIGRKARKMLICHGMS